jgi:chromosome segregation protein
VRDRPVARALERRAVHRGPVYLKSLTVKGFKSFADRVVLTLEPGVTSVVGPNGSGKSNISDAVLWVLGEQSAKTLRGNSMEDVIFAGSSARQAVGVAEVDLVLDNADGTLPLEFTEVTISRRMYRNGESEYLINNSPCRLMDVQDLLHDSGLGRDTNSIISQGRLDEILSSRPEDRRSLIEEAAGVLKHKKRKERALRKLGSMESNLERARDVLGEVERQLRPLQRQADKARQYDGLMAQLRDLEVSLAVGDLRALHDTWDAVLKQERERDADLELARYRLAEKERELGTFQALLEEKGLFVGDLGEQRRRIQAVLERLSSGLLLLEEKGKNLVDRISDLRAKVHGSAARRERRLQEVARLNEERSSADAQLKALYQRLGEVRRESETARKERLAAEASLSEVTAAIRRLRKEADDARADLATVEQSLSAFTLEESLLSERAESLAGQKQSLTATLAARRTRLDETERVRTHTLKQIALAESDVDRRVRVVEARRREMDELRERLTQVRAEGIGLEEVDRAFATATPALAWVLSSERKVPGLVGPLTDVITVEPEIEKAVELALGSDLFCVLVSDAAARDGVLSLLAEHAAGDIAIMALDSASPHEARPGAGRRLSDAISCDASVRPAIEALLGDVYLVPTLEEALDASARFPGSRFATPDGHMVWPSGKVTVGPGLDQSASVLERKRRINELHDDESAASAMVGDSEAVLAEAEEALHAAQQDALELGQQLAARTGEHESMLEELTRLESALSDLENESRSLEQRAATIADRTAKDRPAREEHAERIRETEMRIQELEEQEAVKREARDDRFREETVISDRLAACQVDMATVSEREIHLKRQMSAAAADLAEIEETLSSSESTEAALELLRERIQPVHDLYSALLERAEEWAVKLRDRARFEQTDSQSLRDTIRAAQEAVREAQGALDERVTAMGDVRVEKGQLQVQVDAAVARIVDEFDVSLERALEAELCADREGAAERAHKLRRQIAQIGPVNELAVEEHASLEQRREHLASQIEDLASSRTALTKVVRAIDRKMRDRFLETFEQVAGHFQNVFTLLFPGGHAQLSMTEPDDPEQTGIEVIAQPYGKKLQKMTLMSGGEKSLTALALLFALYRARPCPFYILDEVEAALDDSNLRRFVAFLDTMRSHTQFIVVTHQRRTMEMADVLYGVSMHSDGVSKVVSQKLDHATGRPVDVDGAL